MHDYKSLILLRVDIMDIIRHSKIRKKHSFSEHRVCLYRGGGGEWIYTPLSMRSPRVTNINY